MIEALFLVVPSAEVDLVNLDKFLCIESIVLVLVETMLGFEFPSVIASLSLSAFTRADATGYLCTEDCDEDEGEGVDLTSALL
jgi:hypothetical protein